MRDAGRRDFDDRGDDPAGVASPTPWRGAASGGRRGAAGGEDGGPGVIVLDAHNHIEAADERARELLAQLADQIEPLPGVATS